MFSDFPGLSIPQRERMHKAEHTQVAMDDAAHADRFLVINTPAASPSSVARGLSWKTAGADGNIYEVILPPSVVQDLREGVISEHGLALCFLDEASKGHVRFFNGVDDESQALGARDAFNFAATRVPGIALSAQAPDGESILRGPVIEAVERVVLKRDLAQRHAESSERGADHVFAQPLPGDR